MKKRWIVLAVVLVLVVGAGGLAVLSRIAKVRTAAQGVRIAVVERGALTATVSAPGKVDASTAVNLSAEVPGRIVELSVEEGDRVEKGQLLLRLDATGYESQLRQAEAMARTARANLQLTEARLDKTRLDLDRLERLKESDLASEEALEAARTEHRVLAAELEARRQEVARTEAGFAGARDNLDKTVYRSPISGVVSRLNVEEGENVVVGTMNNPGTVILTVSDMSVMEVEAEVDETDVVHVAVGQPAKITVDALPDTTFPATVVTVGNSGRSRSSGATEASIDFEVRVRFDVADPRLRTGMTADVDIETERRTGVLTVPIQALVARSRSTLEKDLKAAKADATRYAPPDSLTGEARDRWQREIVEGVYRVTAGKAGFVEVKSGIADQARIEVAATTGSLAEGDKVVSGPYRVLRNLKEGDRVREAKAGPGSADEDER